MLSFESALQPLSSPPCPSSKSIVGQPWTIVTSNAGLDGWPIQHFPLVHCTWYPSSVTADIGMMGWTFCWVIKVRVPSTIFIIVWPFASVTIVSFDLFHSSVDVDSSQTMSGSSIDQRHPCFHSFFRTEQTRTDGPPVRRDLRRLVISFTMAVSPVAGVGIDDVVGSSSLPLLCDVLSSPPVSCCAWFHHSYLRILIDFTADSLSSSLHCLPTFVCGSWSWSEVEVLWDPLSPFPLSLFPPDPPLPPPLLPLPPVDVEGVDCSLWGHSFFLWSNPEQ